MTEPLATIVIVTWNGAHLLGPCLDSLRGQTLGDEVLRTVVVDNASTDETDEVLRAYSWAQVVRSPVNLGFAGGATLGLRDVQTPYAVVLNNDAQPEPDWLEKLLAGFADDVAAVTSRVLLQPRYVIWHVGESLGDITMIDSVTVDGRDVTDQVVAQPSGASPALLVPVPDGLAATVVVRGNDAEQSHAISSDVPRVNVINSVGGMLTESGHGADRGYLEVDSGQYDEDADVFAVCGAAAAFRTDVARDLGWFDPWFFAYYEDLDLSWRLRRAGWRIRYIAAARVRHHHAATSRVGSDLFLFHNRRNRLATLARNASARELLHFLRKGHAHAGQGDDRRAVVLGHRPPQESPDGQQVRGRAAALMAFLRHLPTILVARSHDRRRANVLR